MKKTLSYLIGVLLLMTICLSGCEKQAPIIGSQVNEKSIFFFDEARNEIIAEPIEDALNQLATSKEKVEYIINRLVENRSTQLVTLQNNKPIPYLHVKMADDLAENPIIKFYFTEEYYTLTPAEKIGIRASIVFSLTTLDFIEGVEFYVGDSPLMTSVGKPVGVIYPSQIKIGVIDPSPATRPYTLSLYYANAQGKLEKEVRGVLVSDTASLEKLLIEELINGPSVDGLKPTMPGDVKINEVKVANGCCYVDLSFDNKAKFFASDRERELMLYSIVDSLTELPQIKKVVIYLDGQSGIPFIQDIDFGDTLERRESYISQK